MCVTGCQGAVWSCVVDWELLAVGIGCQGAVCGIGCQGAVCDIGCQGAVCSIGC